MTFSSVRHNEGPHAVGGTTVSNTVVNLHKLEEILQDIGRVIKVKEFSQAEMPEVIVNVAAPNVTVEKSPPPVVNIENPIHVTQPAVTVNISSRAILFASLMPTIAILADIAVRILLK
jgi:hypothetical protein